MQDLIFEEKKFQNASVWSILIHFEIKKMFFQSALTWSQFNAL